MRRRRLLQVTASATAFTALAGCTQDGNRGTDEPTDTDDPTDTDEPTDNPGSQPGNSTTTDARETETGTVEDGPGGSSGSSDAAWGSGGEMDGVEYAFSSQSPECGQGEDDVDISFDEEAGEVTLDGVISGSDTCKRATLESVDYDEQNSKLSVVIQTTDREECTDGDMAAGQCIVDIEYEATFTFDDGVPTEASVSHGDKFGASAAHSSSSASAPDDDS